MRKLTSKGYGRIYVEKEEDIELVKDAIKELDEFEIEYLPESLITVFTDYPKVVYTGKFDDMDMDMLTHVCWLKGIKIWVFDAGHDELPKYEGAKRYETAL